MEYVHQFQTTLQGNRSGSTHSRTFSDVKTWIKFVRAKFMRLLWNLSAKSAWRKSYSSHLPGSRSNVAIEVTTTTGT